MELTYSSYLKIDELLALQIPQSTPAEHDEILFIVIHQTYELWFKQLLHEFEKIKRDFSSDDLYGSIHSFKRCRTIMKTLVEQVDILETMTPMSFESFRDRLDTASGFQSVQYRELEFVLGYKRPGMIKYHTGEAAEHLKKRLDERSVYDHFFDFLRHRGVDSGAADRDPLVDRDDAALNARIGDLYRREPSVAILFELMTDFDEGLQEWRYRHVMVVQRTIGDKQGTGGSLGVDFLKKSLFNSCFPILWSIRNELG